MARSDAERARDTLTAIADIQADTAGMLAMKRAGQIVLVPFPFTDLVGAKLRQIETTLRAPPPAKPR